MPPFVKPSVRAPPAIAPGETEAPWPPTAVENE